MWLYITKHRYLVGGLFVTLLIALYVIWNALTTDPLAGLITTTVTKGTVESLVSVSGITKAKNTADLAFPRPGIVSKVYITEGTAVRAGDILATLGGEELIATRASAVADLRVAEADRAELINGVTPTDRTVTNTKVAIAKSELARTTAAQKIAVDNAKRTLRSSDVAARSTDPDERAIAPIISGTYRCDKDGTYTVAIYSSNADSGYSAQISGLESGTYPVSTDQPSPLGTCGLYALFSDNVQYGNTTWYIDIPNPRAVSYVQNKNAVTLAETTAENAITAATEALTLAEQQQQVTVAAPRNEALARADARINKANALIAQIDAQIADLAVVAPFDGTVTRVDIVTGETAGAAAVFTVLATDAIELTARIPEIDVTSITLDQPARVVFDADSSVTFTGRVTYIAPLPIQIDGVAYFEVKITLDTEPAWLRGGLNSDVDIIIASTPDVLRVPKRYVVTTPEGTVVRTLSGTTIATTTVKKITEGNDGFTAIEGIVEGTTVVTP